MMKPFSSATPIAIVLFLHLKKNFFIFIEMNRFEMRRTLEVEIIEIEIVSNK